MPPYDPRANRPAPAASGPDEPSAVDALLEKTASAVPDSVDDATADDVGETIDLREHGTPAAATPAPSPPAAASTGPSPVVIAAAVVAVAGLGWVLVRRRRCAE